MGVRTPINAHDRRVDHLPKRLPGTEVAGTTSIERLGESLLVMRTQFGEGAHHSEMSIVIGRSDANDEYVALYEDDRGVCRRLDMTFERS